MCKNTFLIGIKNPENAFEFITTIAPLMTKSNSDGMGYAVLNNDGMFVERFLTNTDAFTSEPFNQSDIEFANSLGALVDRKIIETENTLFKKSMTYQGERDFSTAKSILLHARKSTGHVCLENVHPFVINNTALVHNGIISNHSDFIKEISTCDSEAILQQYLNHEVNDYPSNIEKVTKTLQGWYACGILTKNIDGLWVIDVFKSVSSNLYVTKIDEIGGFVFSTQKTDIMESLSSLNWELNHPIFPVQPKVFSRFDATTGNILFQSNFEEKSYVSPVITPVISNKKSNKRKYQSDDSLFEEDLGTLMLIYDGLDDLTRTEIDKIQCPNTWASCIWNNRFHSSTYQSGVK